MRYLKLGSIIFSSLAVVAAIGWLFVQNLVPTGIYKVTWRADAVSSRVGPLVPESRVGGARPAADGEAYRTVNAEPVNFNVKVPRSFDTAEVSVKYAGTPKVFEIGGLASRETWTNDMRPAENSIIDALRWTRLTENGLALYEREPKFESVADFLDKMPATGVAVYRASGFPEAAPAGYAASFKTVAYKTAFRGATTIKVYLKNEKLNFIFKVQELNRNAGAETFAATASLAGKEIARASFADDGNVSSDGKLSGLRDLKLYTEEPVTGVVTLNLPAPDDIVFRETVTPHSKFVFSGRIYIADNVGYLAAPAAASVVTDGKRLSATTAHADSFQTLTVGGKKMAINDVNAPFTVLTDAAGGIVNVDSPAGDLRLETAGFFAFGAANYWRPDPPALTAETDVDRDGIDYVLTSYVPPLHEGLWRLAEATFDFSKLAVANGAVNFTLSLPGKTADETFDVAEINVTFKRDPLGWSDLAAFWEKITAPKK